VSVAGQLLIDLTVQREATPLGTDGFQPSTQNGAPFAVGDAHGALPDASHSGAPSTPGSGLPLAAVLTLIGASAVIFILRRRHAKLQTEMFLRQMQRAYSR
jgi:hypothetical protein